MPQHIRPKPLKRLLNPRPPLGIPKNRPPRRHTPRQQPHLAAQEYPRNTKQRIRHHIPQRRRLQQRRNIRYRFLRAIRKLDMCRSARRLERLEVARAVCAEPEREEEAEGEAQHGAEGGVGGGFGGGGLEGGAVGGGEVVLDVLVCEGGEVGRGVLAEGGEGLGHFRLESCREVVGMFGEG